MLVLTVTLSRPNDVVKERCDAWIKSAEQKDFEAIMKDSALYSYSDQYLRKNKLMLNMISKIIGIFGGQICKWCNQRFCPGNYFP